MKKPDLTQDDGPVVDPVQIQSALLSAWGEADPLDIRQGEFTAVDKEVIIESMPPRLVLQDGKTVSQVQDSPTERVYTILQQTLELGDNNQQQTSTSERSVTVDKAAVEPEGLSLEAKNTSLPLSIEKLQRLFYTCVPGEGWQVTCHNLRTSEELVPAPAAVVGREGCEGLTNCQWRKHVVSFDMVVDFLDPDTNTRTKVKQVYTIKMSHDAPYLSRITDLCFQGVGTVQGTPYLATVCEKVVNFRRGEN